jgi:hypothetical protein
MTTNELLLVAGLLFSGVMVSVVIYLAMRPTFTALWVRKHGVRITATVIDAETDINIIGRDSAYHLRARWEDPQTHRVYTFTSDPGRYLLLQNHPPGSPVEVLIDPRHPNRYEMVMQFDEHVYRGYVKAE